MTWSRCATLLFLCLLTAGCAEAQLGAHLLKSAARSGRSTPPPPQPPILRDGRFTDAALASADGSEADDASGIWIMHGGFDVEQDVVVSMPSGPGVSARLIPNPDRKAQTVLSPELASAIGAPRDRAVWVMVQLASSATTVREAAATRTAPPDEPAPSNVALNEPPRPALAVLTSPFPQPAPPRPALSAPARDWSVQVTGFTTAERARAAALSLSGHGLPVTILNPLEDGAPLIRVGPYRSIGDADGALRRLKDLGHTDAVVVNG